MKQATLSSLKGVVVVEEFARQKAILELENISDDDILGVIDNLSKKKPCREVILSTGIGHCLEQLQKTCSKQVALEINKLFDFWEMNKEKSQPTFEVRYDNFTRHLRRTSKKYFFKELGDTEADDKLADILEKEIFHKCKRLTTKSYRRTVRKVIFVLRHNSEEKNALKKGEVSPVHLVKKYQKLN